MPVYTKNMPVYMLQAHNETPHFHLEGVGGYVKTEEPESDITSVVPLSLMPYLSLVFLILSDIVLMNFLISCNNKELFQAIPHIA